MTGAFGTVRPTPPHRRPWKKLFAAIAIAAFALLAGVVVFVLFFSDMLLNRYAKDKIEHAFADAYPGYVLQIGSIHYSAFRNETECRTVSLLASDSSLRASAHSLAVSGIGWHELISQRELTPDVFKRSVLAADDLLLHLSTPGYDIRCEQLRISAPDSDITALKASMAFAESRYRVSCARLHGNAPDSELSAENVEVRPLSGDDDFFSSSPFRRTRAAVKIHQIYLVRAPVLDLLQGRMLAAGALHFYRPEIDLLVNRDKLADPNTPPPRMPAEVLGALGASIRLDSLYVHDARLVYGERLGRQGKPGVITFDSVQLAASGIQNAPRHTISIEGSGRFMNGGTMTVSMRIPMTPRAFALSYRGSLTAMDATSLNRFLETAEHTRISSGVIHHASFDVSVARGRATGRVQIAYEDLYVTLLDKATGSSGGIGNSLTTFIANLVKIRGSNMPGKSGALKAGSVHYVRQRSDTFMNITWFSLRSGVGDLVGF